MSERIDLATLAQSKGLPKEVLRSFGVSDRDDGGVRIDYIVPGGSPGRARYRLALGGIDGSIWEKSDRPITAYWRPEVPADISRFGGALFLCEGESSCWTAWHGGFPAVGLPGADQVDSLTANHLVPCDTVLVVAEPDDPETYPQGRAEYLDRVYRRLEEIGYRSRVVVFDLENVAEDLNAIYREDPTGFSSRVRALVDRVLGVS